MEEERSNREFCTRRPFTVKVEYNYFLWVVVSHEDICAKRSIISCSCLI